MAGFSNLHPRFHPVADPATGNVSTAYKAFFAQLKARRGSGINNLAAPPSGEDMSATINALLAEMRAQGWIGGSEGKADTNFADAIAAVTMIPATGEFCYSTQDVEYHIGDGEYVTLNTHSDDGYTGTDFSRSLDDLQAQAPGCGAVSLFVSWFGSDLRAKYCTIKPKVDSRATITRPLVWSVAGQDRATADEISLHLGVPAYGSTPSDASVIDGIQEMRRRGLAVAFTPFLLMDVPSGSALPSPYGGTQPAYPWRGRITLEIAPGIAGTTDKTAAAADEIAAFMGGADGYEHFILHYANLCAEAGGVDIFVIGSEMRGLTWARSDAVTHPFVDALVALAAQVKAILPDADVIYSADWSEWNNYRPSDGTGDVSFHLDPLWASPDIAAVAIDNYMPLADWRDVPMDGLNNIDGETYPNIYDFDYLMSNVAGGEGFDWYYASDADRDNQVRSSITDGAYNEPWIHRAKDLAGWWSNAHHNRPGGVRLETATAWTPEMKPIWFMELGCPAVDKGANQPNVFVDPKSSESFYPYFSNSLRDDGIQRRHIHAMLRYFNEGDPKFTSDRNPTSAVYSGRMVDINRIFLYTWDARPYAVFPARDDIWSDAENWRLGHWLTGRLPVYGTQGGDVTGGDVSLIRTVMAPKNYQIADPKTGRVTEEWRRYFEAVGFTAGDPIESLAAQPSATEIAVTVNQILTVLRDQKRIIST